MPAVMFLLFLMMPILAAFFLDTDLFVLFLILFCVVGGLCTWSADPLASSRNSDCQDSGPQTERTRMLPTGAARSLDSA